MVRRSIDELIQLIRRHHAGVASNQVTLQLRRCNKSTRLEKTFILQYIFHAAGMDQPKTDGYPKKGSKLKTFKRVSTIDSLTLFKRERHDLNHFT